MTQGMMILTYSKFKENLELRDSFKKTNLTLSQSRPFNYDK